MTNIKASILINGVEFEANLQEPLDISIELSSEKNPQAWYVDLPIITPVMTEHFTGSVALGGAVNFRNIFFNPHGHGTHTECAGHISEEVHSVNDSLKTFFSEALLITIAPDILKETDRWMEKGDLVITKDQLESKWDGSSESLIIRTTPNTIEKKSKNYSDTNPPYIHPDAMEYIASTKIKHLLLDLPSVDRESDKGKLIAHRIFWNYPSSINLERTITEMIFVNNQLVDGMYLLELQVAPFKNDASPSRPVVYRLKVK
tara:strand:- start:8957 stop:9736 length:780 start_codon:yes stop_codon:yes gene_type:complete